MERKICLALLLCSTTLSLKAQVTAKTFFAGGTLNLHLEENYNDFDFYPRVGYVFDGKFAVQGTLGISSSVDERNGAREEYNNISMGAGAKFFIQRGEARKFYLSPFFQVLYGVSTIKTIENWNETRNDTMNEFDIAFAPNVTFFPGDILSLDLAIGRLGYNSLDG